MFLSWRCISIKNPLGLCKYVQDYVFDGAYGTKKDVMDGGYKITYSKDSITELYFENEGEMMRTFADPYVKEVVGPDGLNFSDGSKALPFLVTEQEIQVPNPAEGGIKIFHFLKRNDSITQEEFQKLWNESHGEALERCSAAKEQLRKMINNVQISLGEADYFGSKETVKYDGVFTMWFETTKAFRAYERELAAIAEQKDEFIDQSRSFFLYTDSCTILDLTK